MTWLPRWYANLARTVKPECVLYEDSFIGPFFVLTDYFPVLLSIFLFIFGLYKKELFLILLSLALKWDLLLNLFLRDVALVTSSRFPGCGNESESFSFSFEQGVVFISLMLMYVSLRKISLKTSFFKIVFLYAFATIIMTARVYIGINRVSEIYSGAAVGLGNSMLLIIALHYMLKNYAHGKNQMRIIRFLGIHDTMIRDPHG